jgi:hypothetical protein
VNTRAHSAVEEDDALADEIEKRWSHKHFRYQTVKLLHPFIRIHC